MSAIDLEMLAADMARMFDRDGYPIPATEDDILPALPAFVAQITASAAAADRWEEPGGDAARWSPGLTTPDTARPAVRAGRPPRMTHQDWRLTQGIEIGATAAAEWYWRCPRCRRWAGAYPDILAAKQPGMDHRHREHDVPAARRTEARRAARRVAKHMTAAAFDQVVAHLAAAHHLGADVVQTAIHRTACAIYGYGSHRDALFYTGKDLGTAADGDYLAAPHPKVTALLADIARELGYPGWLERQMARDDAR